MEFFITIFNETLYRPIFNLLVFVYNIIPGEDFGVAIVVVTILLRIVLFPLAHKALKSQKALQELQPKIKELQDGIKNKEEQAKKLMEFYKENNINPFSGCLPLLIQLPVLMALYRVFLHGLDPSSLDALYPFISNPGSINPIFLGSIDLSKPHYGLAILAGVSQYVQAKATFQGKDGDGAKLKSDLSRSMTASFTYIMPIFLMLMSWRLPAGLPLYWIVTMMFSWGQQLVINKSFSKTKNENQLTNLNS